MSNAKSHVLEAIKSLSLEAYTVGDGWPQPKQHVTISEDLKRIDKAIGPKGESIFAMIADKIDAAYIELQAAYAELQKDGPE